MSSTGFHVVGLISDESVQEILKRSDRDLEMARDLAEQNRTLIRPCDMKIASDKLRLCVLLTSQSVSVNFQRPPELQNSEYGLNQNGTFLNSYEHGNTEGLPERLSAVSLLKSPGCLI